MTSFDFDELKQKAINTAESIADISVELYRKAEEKTRIIAKTTKLSAEITRDKATLRRVYGEMGKKYYELHKNDPEEQLARSCAEITATLAAIAEKQAMINDLKASGDITDDDIDVQIITEEDIAEAPADEAPAEEAPADETKPEE